MKEIRIQMSVMLSDEDYAIARKVTEDRKQTVRPDWRVADTLISFAREGIRDTINEYRKGKG